MKIKLFALLLAILTVCAVFASCDKPETPDDAQADKQVTITLDGGKITASDPSVKISGSVATITAGGDYTVSGKIDDGQIVVATVEKDKVKIILNGADITCKKSAPLFIKACKRCVLEMAAGTVNTLTDGANYEYENALQTEPNAAIFSKQDLKIKGTGTLNVNANFNNGITCKDELTIEEGVINVKAVNNGIKGKDFLLIEGGSISVETETGDAISSTQDKDPALGYVSISGGKLMLKAGDEGIQAATKVHLLGGEIEIDAASNGVKAEVEIGVISATVTIKAPGADKGLVAPKVTGSAKINGKNVDFK